jgi:hypothetical protein
MSKKFINVEEIIEQKLLVEFNRKPLEKLKLFGFVLACNDEFTFIHEFDNQIFRLDGYCIFKNDSVKNYRVYDKDEYFLNEVIRVKNIEPQAVPTISIESWAEILRTVNESFPLIVIEREKIDNQVCYIGKLDELKKKSFSLREINPSADWDKSFSYKYADLTKIGFNGEYENTLILVAEHREKQTAKSLKY